MEETVSLIVSNDDNDSIIDELQLLLVLLVISVSVSVSVSVTVSM